MANFADYVVAGLVRLCFFRLSRLSIRMVLVRMVTVTRVMCGPTASRSYLNFHQTMILRTVL